MTGLQTDNTPAFLRSRPMHLLLACAFGAAMIGFFASVGRRPTPPKGDIGLIGSPIYQDRSVLPATSYIELRDRVLSPNREWTTRIETLVQPAPGLQNPVVADLDEVLDTLASRAALRAYNGAPPVVPHAIDQISAASCMVCHEDGLQVEGLTAALIPHSYQSNCTQCHMEQTSSEHDQLVLAANMFKGKAETFEGGSTMPGPPPPIPHTLLMRDNCLACHGVKGPTGLRTTHPERQSCTLCHAPSFELDQQEFDFR